MNSKKIVITGGPGTGKSSLIKELKQRNHTCFDEISRQVILDARKDGIEQLFLTNPLLFSELLLEARIKQYKNAVSLNEPLIFLDRGLPDVVAYMEYAQETYPKTFSEACEVHNYDKVFVLSPWKEIFKSDNERYETFEQSMEIHGALLKTYKRFDYHLIDVPFSSIESRADFILDQIIW